MAGIAEWVCCPGAANRSLLAALANCPFIHRWTHADDRAAAYFALGRSQATGRPVALLAGSGSSAAAMLPAVVDAYYQRRPLLIITVNGGIEHEGMFGTHAVGMELSLPCAVSDLPDLCAALADGFPVHLSLNIGEGVSAAGDYSGVEVAEAPPAPRFRGSLVALSQMLRFRAQEGLVLMLGALNPDEQEPALWMACTLRVPVLAEAASGLREELHPYILHGAERFLAKNPPRYVLRLGDIPTHPFWAELESLPGVEVFSVTRTGFAGLRRRSTVVEGELEQVMKALGDVPHVGDVNRLLANSRHECALLQERMLAAPESTEALVHALSNHACIADVIFIGSPGTIRAWNTYAQTRVPTVYVRTNNCAGGADGTISAFLANAADASCAVCLTGDIALLRDLDAAAIVPQLAPGKRVVAVLNNEGASAARTPGMSPELHRLAVQPPNMDLEAVARLWGAEYYTIRSEADFEVLDSLEDNAFALLNIIPEI